MRWALATLLNLVLHSEYPASYLYITYGPPGADGPTRAGPREVSFRRHHYPGAVYTVRQFFFWYLALAVTKLRELSTADSCRVLAGDVGDGRW
jgi:hypothetical protein